MDALGSLILLNANISAVPAAAVPSAPAAVDVQRFEDAMAGLTDGVTALPGTTVPGAPLTALPPTGDIPGSTAPGTIGDAILGTFDRLSRDWQSGVDKVNRHLEANPGQPMDMGSMVRLQLDLTMLSMQSDMTSRIADRMSQGLQTLFKNQ